MTADITLVNLNMLLIRYGEEVDRERHVPLGSLYLIGALEQAGFSVDFRDYQMCDADDPFDLETFLDFLDNPSPVIGLSCMANLLPFTILAARALKEQYPDRTIILGGVGPKSVERAILHRFPWIDVIARGEGELTGPELLAALIRRNHLITVAGISFRSNGTVTHTPDRERIENLDTIGFPAFHHIDLDQYEGYGMMTSRGCPYACTFCSVAPIWNNKSFSRSPRNIVDEMKLLNEEAGVDLFLFQDEFFISGKKQVVDFCNELDRSGLDVKWKAFGRVNLTDAEMMQAMAQRGCVELRFGIESGSDTVLTRIKKGFTSAESVELISQAVEIFPRVDAFYIWGFPFETMDDFNQTLFQMISFRMMGARILPSLLSYLPQTQIYRELVPKTLLEYFPHLLPEFIFTGHEVLHEGTIVVPEKHRQYFDLVMENPDIFPGFFLSGIEDNVLPKLELLREFGFYPQPEQPEPTQAGTESCGAHSPRISPQELATRA
jgi:anaerobic magnesium-protoporphyrin IX monomethyl ester cyclase